jgi:acetylornithine deacetylase/succinyl-diaminopimelate desuccinylase
MAGYLPEPDPARVEECLAALVACRTENPPGDEAEPARLLAEVLEATGFDVALRELTAGRHNLVATLGDGGGPCLALNSHLDTVPAGPGWRDDPFRLRTEGDRLIGRGACDAKGSVAAMAEAACLLAACSDRWSGRLVVVFVADEEVGSTGAKRFAAEHPGVDRIVVGEPTGLRVVSAHKGCLRPRVRVHGRSAHSGTPQLGENAIIGAHRLIGLLEAEDRRLRAMVHPLVGPASLSVTRIAGGLADNVVPDACELTIDRRMLPGESAETVLPEMEAILARVREGAGVRAEILGFSSTAGPSETPADDPIVRSALRAASRQGIADPGPIGFLGGCDLVHFQRVGIRGVVIGPGSLAQAHQPEEWVARDELARAAALYRDLALDWFATAGSGA